MFAANIETMQISSCRGVSSNHGSILSCWYQRRCVSYSLKFYGFLHLTNECRIVRCNRGSPCSAGAIRYDEYMPVEIRKKGMITVNSKTMLLSGSPFSKDTRWYVFYPRRYSISCISEYYEYFVLPQWCIWTRKLSFLSISMTFLRHHWLQRFGVPVSNVLQCTGNTNQNR